MFIENGFNDFLAKPIEGSRLDEILDRWVPKEKKLRGINNEPPAASDADSNKDNSSLLPIPGLDRGIAMTGGTMKGYQQTLRIYHEDGREKIRQIEAAAKDDNLSLYTIYVHALKSASASIGAESVSEYARNLEMAGQRGDWPYIHSHTAKFIAELSALLDNIHAALTVKERAGREITVDRDALVAQLARLKAAMDDFDAETMNDAAKILQHFTQEGDVGRRVDTILQHKLTGEYDEAVLLIEEVLADL
jgi:HPt (histidine-containing phosphotransfer) domain-containing protein